MKKSFGCVFFLLVSASMSWSTPTSCPITHVTLDVYQSMVSCVLGDKTFGDFTFSTAASGGALAIPASGITVSTIGPSGAQILGPDYGLQFQANWSANASQMADSAIGFSVTVLPGVPMQIEDAGLVQISGVGGDGSASVAEKGCGPVPCVPGTWGLVTFDNTSGHVQTVAHVMFAPTGSIQVIKDIGVSGGLDGFATLSVVQDTFSQTPAVAEGRTSLLIGTGLLLIGWLRFKQRRLQHNR